jgi:nucleoside-diphosphate-sugar epimerase
MTDTLLVTGGTGLAGSTVALLAASLGHQVRALVRGDPDVAPLRAAGIEVVPGDITDPSSLDDAMRGVTGVIHTAAALGGTWSKNTPADMWRVNHDGALNVLDAAGRAGVRRTVLIDSQSVIDPAFTQTERSPVILISDLDSAYVRSKRAMFYAAMHRASLGQDLVVVTPGAIYGPGIFVERALELSSFNSVLLRGMTGVLESYLSFPMMWTYVADLAEICLRALSGGRIGRRYLAMGDDADVSSIAEFCNQGAAIAGLPGRVRDIDPADPSAPDIGTMRQFAARTYATPLIDCSATTAELGYRPTPRSVALRATIDWLRSAGKLPAAGVAR